MRQAIGVSLAYVFWHQPRAAAADYEPPLVDFHEALRRSPVEGLLGSRSFRVPALPWLADGGYEDWYVVSDFAALGRLNEAAVDSRHMGAHDAVAALAGGAVGGLYALMAGDALLGHRFAAWFGKPGGMAYADLLVTVGVRDSELPPGAVALWQRQLLLGPAPEFVLTGERELRFDPGLQPFEVEVSQVG
jgi:hypothetical protein